MFDEVFEIQRLLNTLIRKIQTEIQMYESEENTSIRLQHTLNLLKDIKSRMRVFSYLLSHSALDYELGQTDYRYLCTMIHNLEHFLDSLKQLRSKNVCYILPQLELLLQDFVIFLDRTMTFQFHVVEEPSLLDKNEFYRKDVSQEISSFSFPREVFFYCVNNHMDYESYLYYMRSFFTFQKLQEEKRMEKLNYARKLVNSGISPTLFPFLEFQELIDVYDTLLQDYIATSGKDDQLKNLLNTLNLELIHRQRNDVGFKMS